MSKINNVYERKINYYETDRMGVVHHSNYIRFMEEGRCFWLEQIEMPFESMEEKGITGYDNDYLSITYVAPYTKTTVDSKLLKEKYKDIFNECSKTSEVKSSIRIKVKGE